MNTKQFLSDLEALQAPKLTPVEAVLADADEQDAVSEWIVDYDIFDLHTKQDAEGNQINETVLVLKTLNTVDMENNYCIPEHGAIAEPNLEPIVSNEITRSINRWFSEEEKTENYPVLIQDGEEFYPVTFVTFASDVNVLGESIPTVVVYFQR